MTPSLMIRSGFKIILATFFFLLTIEICARIDDAVRFDAPLWGEYTDDRLRSTDDEGIRYNVPYARFEKWRHNQYGFRGPEMLSAKAPGVLRVVCLGASESYGLYESPGMEWPAQLSKLLPGSQYEVINVSVVGLSSGVYEAYLKKYVLPLEPDIIICFVNPLFHATNFEISQEAKVSSGKPATKTKKKSTVTLGEKIVLNVRCLSKVKQVLKRTLENYMPKELQRYQVRNMQKQVEAAESLHLKGRKPKDSVSDSAVISYKNELRRIVSLLESLSIKVMLSTYPSLISTDNLATYPEIFLDNRRFSVQFSLKGMIDVLEKYNSAIIAVSVERGTMLIDSQRLVPKTTEYFGDNVHYTNRGSQIIAEGIAAQLRDKPYIATRR